MSSVTSPACKRGACDSWRSIVNTDFANC